LLPQQDAFAVPQVDPGKQHDRVLAADWQHPFAAGAGVAPLPLAGITGVVQAQARAGTTAPIAVATASRRQTIGRSFRAKSMVESYTR
jgi:hypothetical protein